MDKAQDVSVPNNCTVNDDDGEDETPRHSQKIVELTENEIKKFGVQNVCLIFTISHFLDLYFINIVKFM